MAIEPIGSGPGASDETANAAGANTDVEIWRAGQPALTRADIDALIDVAATSRTFNPGSPKETAIRTALEKLQIIRMGDYYADRIFLTQSHPGVERGIGIDCGGTVIVQPLRAWHKLALDQTRRQEIEPRDPDAAGLFICSMDGGTHQGSCPTCGCVVQAPYSEASVENMGFDWAALQRLRVSDEPVFRCPYCLDYFTAGTYTLHRCSRSKRPPEAPR